MKIIKIGGKDYVLKYTSEIIQQLHCKDITLTRLIEDMQEMKLNSLYDTFFYGLKNVQHDITFEKALSIIDEYFEEDENNEMEILFNLIIEEYGKAMGLGKKVKELLKQQEQEKKEQEKKKKKTELLNKNL